MGLFNRKKDGNMKMLMDHYSGLPGYPKKCPCHMILDEDEKSLIFKPYMINDIPVITLPLSKVKRAKGVAVEEIKKQSKTGRAVAGGLLFGSAGAVLGALTADEKKNLKSVYVIDYISDGEEKQITLNEKGNMNYFKFQKKLAEYLQQDKEELSGNIEL